MLEWNFHSRSQKLGMEFSRSRSQKLGMKFFIPVPVPKVWEWAEPFPFPFPNDQKSFPLTPASSSLDGNALRDFTGSKLPNALLYVLIWLNMMFAGLLFAIPFPLLMSDITYSPRARYRGWPGAGDGTIQHLEYKTTNLKQRI